MPIAFVCTHLLTVSYAYVSATNACFRIISQRLVLRKNMGSYGGHTSHAY